MSPIGWDKSHPLDPVEAVSSLVFCKNNVSWPGLGYLKSSFRARIIRITVLEKKNEKMLNCLKNDSIAMYMPISLCKFSAFSHLCTVMIIMANNIQCPKGRW